MSNLSLKFKLPFSYYSRSNLEELKPSKNGRQTILCKDSIVCVINQIHTPVISPKQVLSTWFFQGSLYNKKTLLGPRAEAGAGVEARLVFGGIPPPG